MMGKVFEAQRTPKVRKSCPVQGIGKRPLIVLAGPKKTGQTMKGFANSVKNLDLTN